jgi:integrase/recombinase XerC
MSHLRALEQGGRHSPETIYSRRGALRRLAAALPGGLLDATAADLAAWRNGLTVAPGTITDYVSHAREFYDWAIGAGLLEENPAAGLVLPRRVRRLPRPIAETDLFTAVDSAPRRIRPWLVLAAWCGLRAKEIAYLRRENILDTVRPAALLIAEDATKGTRERMVPLCAYALGELHAYGLAASGYVFRRRDGQRGPNSPGRISHMTNDYLHGLGIAATLHQCRHRFATQAYRGRRDLRMVQELLGHANPSTTAGYAAFDQGDAVGVVEDLPAPGRLRVVTG